MGYHDDFHLQREVKFQLPSHILTNKKVQACMVFESFKNKHISKIYRSLSGITQWFL